MCLQVIRLLVLEDMKVIRSLCVPCFPPSFDIVNLYVQMYHKSLANRVSYCGVCSCAYVCVCVCVCVCGSILRE